MKWCSFFASNFGLKFPNGEKNWILSWAYTVQGEPLFQMQQK